MIANYEPYFNKIRKFHQEVYDELLGESFVEKETQMFVLQCNYKEYVENDHDGNYSWYRLCLDNDVEKDFAVGFNIPRFKNHEREIETIISKIKEIWKQNCGAQVDLLNTITNVAALKKNDYEMIVSVHFWFDKSVVDDGIEDTQYMKIVYTGMSIAEIIIDDDKS